MLAVHLLQDRHHLDELLLRARELAAHQISNLEREQVHRREEVFLSLIGCVLGGLPGHIEKCPNELVHILEYVLAGNLVDLGSIDAHLGVLLAVLRDVLLLRQERLQVGVLLIQELHVVGDLLVLGVGY